MNRGGGYSGRSGFSHHGGRFKDTGCFSDCCGTSNDEEHPNNGTKCYCYCCNIF